jgi:hypothetical protein
MVAERSDSALAFERARRWLSHCVEHDKACRPDDTAGPRRLLQLLSSDISRVRLIEFEESVKRPEYACLSYCWGSDVSDILMTTEDNIHNHLEEIWVDKLPKTIGDAIKICRELRIGYLWIDSLCIIQRDGDDFAAEGSKMDLIYANSHVTLYAKAPRSCKQGFLGPQARGNRQSQTPLPGRAPNGLRLIARSEDRVDTDNEVAALETRGWCFQESILSKRQLIYWGLEMEWKCLCRRICECGFLTRDAHERGRHRGDASSTGCNNETHGPIYGPIARAQHLPAKYASEALSIHTQETQANIDHVVKWYEIVEEYSRRALTNFEDRLPALSGLAKRLLHMAEHRNGLTDSYYAGLFGTRFVDTLCWVCARRLEDEEPDGFSPPNHLQQWAPSWSWASVQEPVVFRNKRGNSIGLDYDEAEAVIHEIFCEPVHPSNPMGAVKHGYVDITAPVLPVKIEKHVADANFPWRSRDIFWLLTSDEVSQTAHIVLDNEQGLPWLPDDAAEITPKGKQRMHGRRKYHSRILRDQYFACRLRTWMWGTQDLTLRRRHTDFLILQKTPDGNMYQRVGFGLVDVDLSTETLDLDPLFTADVAEQRIRII